MLNRGPGVVCFFVSDEIIHFDPLVNFINGIADKLYSTFVITDDEVIRDAQKVFSSHITLLTLSIKNTASSRSVFKQLIHIVDPTIVISCVKDEKGHSFLKHNRIKSKKISISDDKAIVLDGKCFANDDLMVKHLEDKYNIDFTMKFYAQYKAFNSKMSVGQLLKAIFFRKRQVYDSFEEEWGYQFPFNPKTFNEKIWWLKAFGQAQKYRCFADKIKARKVVAKMGYRHLLPRCFGIANKRIKSNEWAMLPNEFIIKYSNASGYNILVKNKNDVNLKEINRALLTIKTVKYGLLKNEAVYPCRGKFIIDEYLGDVIDYKFICHNGEIAFVMIVREWKKESTSREPFQLVVDQSFKELPFSFGYEKGMAHFEKPSYFGEMVDIVKTMSKGLSFVRIDMMGNDQRFYFGEFTFFPGSGKDRFNPHEYDSIMGSIIDTSQFRKGYKK